VAEAVDQEPFLTQLRQALGLVSETGKGDMSMALVSLFEQCDAHDSTMMRVLKAIQQRIIFPPAFKVKRKVSGPHLCWHSTLTYCKGFRIGYDDKGHAYPICMADFHRFQQPTSRRYYNNSC
jgi:hypothetical protein